MRFFRKKGPVDLATQIAERETSEGKARPIPWRPLFVIGSLTMLFIFVFSCGTFLFFIVAPDRSDDPLFIPQPQNADEFNFRGIDFADQGDLQRALADFTTAIGMEPGLARAYYNRGVTYNKLKQYIVAVQDFTTTIDLIPNHEGAMINRAFAYTLLGLDTEAEADVIRAIELGVDEEELRARIEGARLSRDPGLP
ncbi:MAG: tetratricopeptide repeat protein [Dehalococcoidia bacterium]